MKPKRSRFDERPALTADPEPTGVPHLDVEGQVELDGDRAVAVTLAGERHALDADGLVVIAGRRYVFARLGGRAALVPA